MKKLAVLQSAPLVEALMRRLEEASVEAFSTTERSVTEVYLGGAPSVSVWVANPDDLRRALGILQELRARQTESRPPVGCFRRALSMLQFYARRCNLPHDWLSSGA